MHRLDLSRSTRAGLRADAAVAVMAMLLLWIMGPSRTPWWVYPLAGVGGALLSRLITRDFLREWKPVLDDLTSAEAQAIIAQSRRDMARPRSVALFFATALIVSAGAVGWVSQPPEEGLRAWAGMGLFGLIAVLLWYSTFSLAWDTWVRRIGGQPPG